MQTTCPVTVDQLFLSNRGSRGDNRKIAQIYFQSLSLPLQNNWAYFKQIWLKDLLSSWTFRLLKEWSHLFGCTYNV